MTHIVHPNASWYYLVYERLARTLAPRALNLPVQPALLTVALPLLRRVHTLPAFSKQTRQCEPRTLAVRQALLEARAPDELLFERLPLACDLTPFNADDIHDASQIDWFAARLSEALLDLQDAYPRLLRLIETRIISAFGLESALGDARTELQTRHAAIAETTNDPLLRSMGVRLETADPVGNGWLESLAALVAKRPPEVWRDADIPAFEIAITDLGRRFRAAEELALTARVLPAEAPLLRVGFINGHGEVSRVLRLVDDDPAVQQLRADLNAALGRHGALTPEQRAAALATLLQSLLEE